MTRGIPASSRLVLASAFTLLLVAGVGTAATGPSSDALEARSRAWAVRVMVPGEHVLEAGVVSARAGLDPVAVAVPGSVGGQSPMRADAHLQRPEDVQRPASWEDDFGSMTVDGPYAESRVTPGTANARGGVGSFAASGFAVADELLTWEQQELMLGTWVEVNEALFARLNTALGALVPVLDPLGLRIPELEPMAATGFIDVARGRGFGSDANAVVSGGFTSADASADITSIRLFSGFVVASGVSTSASVESSAGVTVPHAKAEIERVRVAGIDVAARDGGLVVAGNHEPFAELLQPVLDLALELLAESGIRLAINEVRADEQLAQATALLIEIPTSAGQLAVSLGYAEAEATAVTALAAVDPPSEEPAPVTAPPDDQPRSVSPPEADPSAGFEPPVTSAPSLATDTPAPAPALLRLPPLPVAAAQAIQSAYLLVALAGMVGGLLLPALVRPPRVRSQVPGVRPSLDGG